MPNHPVGTCAECETEDRVLKYARGTMCCKYRCQRAAHALVVARKGRAAGKGDGGDKKLKAPPTFCYEVVPVHGQQDFNPAHLFGAKRRNRPAESDINVSYLIFGTFGEDEHDVGFNDMRWVELSDLIQLPKAEQKKITKFDKSFAQRMADRKQKVQEAAEEEDE